MLKLQMLPAGCGDCLWLEYGEPPQTRIVIIDGGLRVTADALRARIEAARRERNAASVEVELLVVTHIDNDHILGIIELLRSASPSLRVKDIWFNGRRQLEQLPTLAPVGRTRTRRVADLMDGSGTDDEDEQQAAASVLPEGLLGPPQGDELSKLLSNTGLPWNRHPRWNGEAVFCPDSGELPVVPLDGGLVLTLLGPRPSSLHRLLKVWPDVLTGKDENTVAAEPPELLGRRDRWPPAWQDGEQRDASAANGSSIMLLAEYGDHALLLSGDGHAGDIDIALERLRQQKKLATPLPLTAFKLPHHASAHNITRAVLDQISCSRYLISTDGSVHAHPDHQALLRILRYSKLRPELMFNYLCGTTRPWRDSQTDVLDRGFQAYTTTFPCNAADGLILDLQ
jgi:hypothetical protein